jgi:hypothetical protein
LGLNYAVDAARERTHTGYGLPNVAPPILGQIDVIVVQRGCYVPFFEMARLKMPADLNKTGQI